MDSLTYPGEAYFSYTARPDHLGEGMLQMDALTCNYPSHRTIIVMDVENSTARTNPGRAQIRRAMYELIEIASRMSGVTSENRDPLVDRGDGVIMLIHPVDRLPKTMLLSRFIPCLARLLADHNRRNPNVGFRLRIAMHAGEVHFDHWGPFGESVDLACRLVDAAEFRAWLRMRRAPLALVVSDDVYSTMVNHGYKGIEALFFHRVVHVDLAGYSEFGWVSVPPLVGVNC
ncbi:MAG TPA: hypothetical protein VFV67_00450 [Actinophytocola sp.]|uniref:hypothetical protein n=1 Tax=Actinophytocola sp. TaxID=1872138 RepID=UPI002DB5A8A4|nr:hypothetical protein [Actinophytocola sp.]HEU5469092.1 hypothetical protein [Actinophytocola sp.]